MLGNRLEDLIVGGSPIVTESMN